MLHLPVKQTDVTNLSVSGSSIIVTNSTAFLKMSRCFPELRLVHSTWTELSWLELIWTDLNKSTQLHDAFIGQYGHKRQRHDYILRIDWLRWKKTVSARLIFNIRYRRGFQTGAREQEFSSAVQLMYCVQASDRLADRQIHRTYYNALVNFCTKRLGRWPATQIPWGTVFYRQLQWHCRAINQVSVCVC